MENLLSSRRASLLAALSMQNMTLKIALVGLGVIVLIETVGLFSLAFKKPLIVALEGNQPRVILASVDDESISVPEIRAFINDVLSHKFSKTPNSEMQRQSCRFFTEGLKEACEKESNNKKLLIPQDFIVQEIAWDERSESAHLNVKRFATFNGTISAVELKLFLKVQKRRRTEENPWGLFISEWKEMVQK